MALTIEEKAKIDELVLQFFANKQDNTVKSARIISYEIQKYFKYKYISGLNIAHSLNRLKKIYKNNDNIIFIEKKIFGKTVKKYYIKLLDDSIIK